MTHKSFYKRFTPSLYASIDCYRHSLQFWIILGKRNERSFILKLWFRDPLFGTRPQFIYNKEV